MRSIPGTITEYGIENRLAAERAVRVAQERNIPDTPESFIIKVTYRDGTVSVGTNEGRPYTEDEADVIVASLSHPSIKASTSVIKVKI
jgi:hypothetical protein